MIVDQALGLIISYIGGVGSAVLISWKVLNKDWADRREHKRTIELARETHKQNLEAQEKQAKLEQAKKDKENEAKAALRAFGENEHFYRTFGEYCGGQKYDSPEQLQRYIDSIDQKRLAVYRDKDLETQWNNVLELGRKILERRIGRVQVTNEELARFNEAHSNFRTAFRWKYGDGSK